MNAYLPLCLLFSLDLRHISTRCVLQFRAAKVELGQYPLAILWRKLVKIHVIPVLLHSAFLDFNDIGFSNGLHHEVRRYYRHEVRRYYFILFLYVIRTPGFCPLTGHQNNFDNFTVLAVCSFGRILPNDCFGPEGGRVSNRRGGHYY